MRLFIVVVAWLAAGHAVLGGIFWALLHVPESNALMIALSFLLVALFVVAAAQIESLALLSLSWPRGARLRQSLGAVPAFLAALVPFGLAYWLTTLAARWLAAHRGEIDAWLLLHARLTNTGWVHATLGWLLWFACFGVGLSIALAVFATLVRDGLTSLRHVAWLRAALRPARLGRIVALLLLLVWLPWQAVYWRPSQMPSTWLEPAFVTSKLLILYVLANLGWALVLRAGRQTT